jgi:hypothetical protein
MAQEANSGRKKLDPVLDARRIRYNAAIGWTALGLGIFVIGSLLLTYIPLTIDPNVLLAGLTSLMVIIASIAYVGMQNDIAYKKPAPKPAVKPVPEPAAP